MLPNIADIYKLKRVDVYISIKSAHVSKDY